MLNEAQRAVPNPDCRALAIEGELKTGSMSSA